MGKMMRLTKKRKRDRRKKRRRAGYRIGRYSFSRSGT